VEHGLVLELHRKQGWGYIRGNDGKELYFDRRSLQGIELTSLSIGQAVEFRVQFGPERLRAIEVRPSAEGRGQFVL
jgi:cold shock CspA family protein